MVFNSNFRHQTRHKNAKSAWKVISLLGVLSFLSSLVHAQNDFNLSSYHRLLQDASYDSNQIIEGADQNDIIDDDTPPSSISNVIDPQEARIRAAEEAALEASRQKAKTSANVNKDALNDFEMQDIMKRYQNGEYRLTIESITPRGGPTSGGTRVVVRMNNLGPFVDAYPKPKCKFGSNKAIVEAAYIKCTASPGGYHEKDKKTKSELSSICVQCESSPQQNEAEIVSFTVSLTGKFDDTDSSYPFRYYQQPVITGIYPRYGPKDGDTAVQIWGKNFIDLGDDFRCNFGTKSTKAHFINSGYLWCRVPSSDVVGRPMPVSLSLNRQQMSAERISYWFYNMQSISKVEPDFGQMTGDQKIIVRGQNFMPFDYVKDIDNQNDTFCNWGSLGKTPGQALSQTEMECLTPANPGKLNSVVLRVTINNQNYTDDGPTFSFYNPPNVLDMSPNSGPIRGGTKVDFYGSDFQKKNLTCFFNKIEVKGIFVSKQHVYCLAPNVTDPGDYKLTIKYGDSKFESSPFNFKYFADPVVSSISPICGPQEGFSQILVTGSYFTETSFGKAKCVFNGTYYMNATVINQNTLYCDSPPLESTNGDMFYNLSVSMDGGVYISNSNSIFNYYKQPVIQSISPSFGPIAGGTVTAVRGKGFADSKICDFRARFGETILQVEKLNDTYFQVTSPAANSSGSVVVSVSGNNQQFIKDITLHFRDVENTFEYIQPFLIQGLSPLYLPNFGQSDLHIKGMLFDQFIRDLNNTKKDVQLLCRFVQDGSQTVIAEAKMRRVSDNEQRCPTPKTEYTGDARVELSVNNQQWQDSGYKVKFFVGPKVTSVSPTYGVTKNPKGLNLTIYGENFDCPNNDCTQIKVKFVNENNETIYEDGHKIQANAISCPIPRYPAPETMRVEISMNNQDFTNNQVKYGFMDPYVLDIKPKLLSPKGTTQVTLIGYGFVNLDDGKNQVQFKSLDGVSLSCNNQACTSPYKVLNEHEAQVSTKELSALTKKGSPLTNEPINIDMMNPDGDYTPNGINLYYFTELSFANVSTSFAYANEEKPILISTDFKWDKNDFTIFRKYAQISCRFNSSTDSTISVVVPAIAEISPIGAYHVSQLPNQIRCRTPKWNTLETITLEVSINGIDFVGNYQIQIVNPLNAFRLSPMAGPVQGNTLVKVYGSGLTSSIPKSQDVFVRFGTGDVQKVDKAKINEQDKWSDKVYYSDLSLTKNLLSKNQENDVVLAEDSLIQTYIGAITADISSQYAVDKPDFKNRGGPVYVQLSEQVPIPAIDHGPKRKGELVEYTETVYPDSSNLEFYFYRTPYVKKIEPTMGLAQGGTDISITGAWFMQLPQYGIFPFCKIGGNVVRAKFVTTNRIVCKSPPSVDILTPSNILVSLNGIDWHETGFVFNYYERPILEDMLPKSSSIEGGTELWMKGKKFSNFGNLAKKARRLLDSQPSLKSVRCRFRQQYSNSTEADDDNVPTKYMPATFIDAETMKCATPSGWQGGDQVRVDLTFNGVDYTDFKILSFYAIFDSFPKSGPADATTEVIQIKGKGFMKESTIVCDLNNVEVAPVEVQDKMILCPMVTPGWDPQRYESVNFNVVIDGSRREFGNFHYYQQITINNVNPLLGPNQGHGAIYFSGSHFKSDFENAKVGCRIGNIYTSATVLDSFTIRCTLNKKIPLVDEGQSLPVSVALNSYSWVKSDFSFKPYGIINMYPNQGPLKDNTNIIVVGKGFNNELQESARCKFGTDENYQIVEAQVLDDEHLICKSPQEDIVLPSAASDEISVPFSIAFQDDIYFPYTESAHKFRQYKHPVTIDNEPNVANVGKLTEVYIYAEEENGFKQPVPTPGNNYVEQDQFGMKCKFGRFGPSTATYINKTTILCLTPNIQEDPSDISSETVTISVALNGIDFNDEYTKCEFTFIGTGANLSIMVMIMGTLVFAMLIVAVFIFLQGIKEYMLSRSEPVPFALQNPVTGRIEPAMRAQSRVQRATSAARNAPSRSINSRQLLSRANQQRAYN